MKKIVCFLVIMPLLFASCSSDIKLSDIPLKYIIKTNLFSPSVVGEGDDMPDGKILDTNGKKIYLSDYEGKYLLLHFWTKGCGVSLTALPEMKEISETYHDELTVISINFDTDAAWKNKIAPYDIPWVNVRDPKRMSGLYAKYTVEGSVPYFVIISPEGKVIDKWNGYDNGIIKSKVSENVEYRNQFDLAAQ